MSLAGPRPLAAADRRREGLRLALDVDLGCWAVDPDVEREVRAAAAALADAGAIVEEVDIGWTRELNDAWAQHWGVYLEAIFGHVRRRVPRPHGSSASGAHGRGPGDGRGRVQAPRVRPHRRLEASSRRCSSSYDALLCPTMSQAARPVDEDDDQLVRRSRRRALPRPRPDGGLQLHEPVPGAVGPGRLHRRGPAGRPADRGPQIPRRRGPADRRRAGASPALGRPPPTRSRPRRSTVPWPFWCQAPIRP